MICYQISTSSDRQGLGCSDTPWGSNVSAVVRYDVCALVCDKRMHNRLSPTNVVLVYLYKNKNIDTDIQVKKGHKRVHRLVCACACFNGDNHAIQSTSK